MFKRLRLKLTKGNVLAAAIIIGGTAGAVALSMYAITSSDVKISSQKEDSLLAYQAASGGIDLALMYYKFNHNVQLSDTCENTNDPACVDPTSTTGLPLRIFTDRLGCADLKTDGQLVKDTRDMSTTPGGKRFCAGVEVNGTNQYSKVTSNPNQNLPSNERIFDLKIWYKDSKIGDPTKFNTNYQKPGAFKTNDDYDPAISRVVNQDNSYQIDGLEKVNSFQLYLRPKEWAKKRDEFIKSTGLIPEDPNTKPYQDLKYHDQFQNIFCNGNISNTDPNELTLPNTDWCAYYVIDVPPLGVDLTGLVGRNPIYGLRQSFDPRYPNGFKVQLQNTFLKTYVNSVRIRPINMDMQFAIDDIRDFHNNPLNIDTGITHIEVTGYYGGAKRKLEAKMDRKTNAFLGIFDRTLYVGEGDLAP